MHRAAGAPYSGASPGGTRGPPAGSSASPFVVFEERVDLIERNDTLQRGPQLDLRRSCELPGVHTASGPRVFRAPQVLDQERATLLQRHDLVPIVFFADCGDPPLDLPAVAAAIIPRTVASPRLA